MTLRRFPLSVGAPAARRDSLWLTRVGPLGAVALLLAQAVVRADALTPPWYDDVPLPAWTRSVVPSADARGKPGDLVLFSGPNLAAARRGVTAAGATLPVFGAKRGPGCDGSWWLVGPLAWVCSDRASLSPEEPSRLTNALGSRYFFVSARGTSAYTSLLSAVDGESDHELEGGWAVAVVDERSGASGERFARTTKGLWIALRDLSEARPSSFEGVEITGSLDDFAWVVADRARGWSSGITGLREKVLGVHARFEMVRVLDRATKRVRIAPEEWMNESDLAQPHLSAPPVEASRPNDRWIDIDLVSQTLVAYEGPRPVYATLVSTGRGPTGSQSATPPGVHRIWVKLRASDMDNVDRDDLDAHYSLEDVPFVQFFDRAIGLHGAYWHNDFGHVKSHGCVNVSPRDSKWLFDFTEPRVPAGWVATYPTEFDPGTVVRVH